MTNDININIEIDNNSTPTPPIVYWKTYFNYKEPIEIDNDLECMICLSPLSSDAIVEPKCRSMFCRNCLTDCLNKSDKCPFCQQSVDITTCNIPPKFVTNTLDDLLVYCLECNSGNGNKNEIEYIQRRDYSNHFETKCKVACKNNCGQFITRNQQISHEQQCKLSNVQCRAKNLLCPWNGTNETLSQHESTCHFIALSPILTVLTNRINQLQTENQTNLTFLLNKINFLESIISPSTISTTTTTTNHKEEEIIPKKMVIPIALTTSNKSMGKQTSTTTTTTSSVHLSKVNDSFYHDHIDRVSSIQNFNNYLHLIGKPPPGTKSISLDKSYQDVWPVTKNNLSNSVDTLVLLDGFSKLIYEIPKSIKTIHIGNVNKGHDVYLYNGSLNEIHFHDYCTVQYQKGVIPDSVKEVHFYRVSQQLFSDSIGKNVKILYFHDGFSQLIGYGMLQPLSELHLYNITSKIISIPQCKTLYLHDGFKYENLELSNPIDILYLYDIVYPIKSFPSSLKLIYIQGYKHDQSSFPHKAKILEI